MSVPDTDTFTLQDVVDEVNPTTNDLVDCFSDAIAGNFDPAYSGSKNSLLNFRNYGITAYCDYIGATGYFNSGVSSLAVNTSSLAQVGDLLVLILRVQKGITYSAPPVGWSASVISPPYSTTYPNITIFYKTATAADLSGGASDNVTVNLTGTAGAYVYLSKLVIRTSAVTPFNFGTNWNTYRFTGTSSSPTITLNKANSVVVALADVGASTSISNTGAGWGTVANTVFGANVSDRVLQQKDIYGLTSPSVSFLWSGSSPYTSFIFEIL